MVNPFDFLWCVLNSLVFLYILDLSLCPSFCYAFDLEILLLSSQGKSTMTIFVQGQQKERKKFVEMWKGEFLGRVFSDESTWYKQDDIKKLKNKP